MVIGTVNDLSFKSYYAGLDNPAIIFAGEVASRHQPQIKKIITPHFDYSV